MFLKRIEIHGFKSMADKVELQLNPGISAIVGPNGSGKSNIADAVRWVLGEQSAKSLRGARMEDIIFSGSDRRKPVGMAEVSLTLDNSDSVFPIDYSEVTVTRRMYRSGESEYFINKTSCRLREIHELFMDTGVGKEGYSIIGQGKIDEILNAKPEDRRNIIEEAAGIVKYRARKHQAVKKLNDTEQNLTRIQDIIIELKSHIGPLEEQCNKAKEYLEYKAELENLEINLLVNQIKDQEANLEQLDIAGEKFKREFLSKETALRNLESEIESGKMQVDKLDEEINAIQKELYQTKSLTEQKEADKRIAGERLKNIVSQKQILENEILELKEKQLSEKDKHEIDQQAFGALKEKIDVYEKMLSEGLKRVERLDTLLHEEQKTIEESKTELIDLLNEMAGVKNSINAGQVEMQNLLRRKNQLIRQTKDLDQELVGSEQKLKKLNELIKSSDEAVARLKEQEMALIKSRDLVGHRIRELSVSRAEILETLQNKLSRLKALIDLRDQYEGYYRGVKEVLMESKKGNACPGICGIVADVIKVPKVYETAIEVALGGALQHIITETDTDARKAIEFLKKNKAGRATFLPLNTIKPSAREKVTEKIAGFKGLCGIASSLVNCDSKYSHIISYLLGRVIVVEDIRSAQELARLVNYTVKIVTIDGDVVNPGGSMTGGTYNKSSSGLLGRAREIEQLSNEKVELTEQLQAIENELQETEEDYERYKLELEGVQTSLQELYMENNSLQKDRVFSLNEKKRLLENKKLIEDEICIIEKDINKTENMINVKKTYLEELQTRDVELRSVIDHRKSKIIDQEKEKAEAAESVTKIKIELAGLYQEEVNLNQLMNRARASLNELHLQIDKKLKQVEEFKVKQNSLKREMEQCDNEIQSLREEQYKKEEYLNRIKNDRLALLNIISEKETTVRALSKETVQIKEKAHEIEVKRTRLEIEIKNSTAKLTEEFGIDLEKAVKNSIEIDNKKKAISRIRELRTLITNLGVVNTGAIEQYQQVRERYDFLTNQRADLEQAKEALYKVIEEMDNIMIKRFREAFSAINENFRQVFAKLFGGGRAELSLTDSNNLLETGIEIFAQPPGKKNQHLSLLSGGERALTAISLLFAILKTKPSPFCILDEIEASLDEANVGRFAEYLNEFAENTQFIVITHRKGTMEAADMLYGVTMDDSGVTKLVSVRMTDAVSKVS